MAHILPGEEEDIKGIVVECEVSEWKINLVMLDSDDYRCRSLSRLARAKGSKPTHKKTRDEKKGEIISLNFFIKCLCLCNIESESEGSREYLLPTPNVSQRE